MRISALTGADNYFEDFTVGDEFRHARGKTVTEIDGVLLTHLVMNTAQGHFNEHVMRSTPFGGTIVFGGVIAAIVVGLAYEDTGEQALAEIGLTAVRFRAPVHHGDTLYAISEVITTSDGEREDAGEVTFRHRGVNHNDELVFEGERCVLLKRRSHWGNR